MNQLLLTAIGIALFSLPFAVCFWLIIRVHAVKRCYVESIDNLTRGIRLVDDIDDRVSKVRARSKENEVDILRLERQFRKLSTAMASQAARDGRAEAELQMTQIADYIQKPDGPENEAPDAPQPDIDPAYV